MGLDPAWIPILSGFIGGFTVWAGSLITDMIRYRREEKQRQLDSRKIAYYKFIDIFSTPTTDGNVDNYFLASMEAAEYGNVILSDPLNVRPLSIAFEIKSLDNLLAALIFMKSSRHIDTCSKTAFYENVKDLEDLRSKALTPFLNEFMNRLRQNESHLPSAVNKKGRWLFWRR